MDERSTEGAGRAAAAFPLMRLFQVAIVFLVSAAGLVVEIVAGRMLAPYVGMSLYTWTAVIAVVLAGFSIGHWIGGRLADTPETTAWRGLAVSLFLAALTTLAAIWLIGPLSEPILTTFPHPVAGITLFATALFLLPSLFVGIPAPVVARLAISTGRGREGRILGTLYAAGAVGAIFGTLAAGYLFISWLGTTWTLIVVALVYAGLGVAVSVVAMNAAAGRIGAATIGLLVLILAVLATPRAAISPCTQESRYYCLRSVDMSGDIGMPARAMILDHLGHGINVGPAPRLLLVPYTSIMNALVETRFGDRPIAAFFLGGGAYTLPRAWAAAGRPAEITVAEIDPAVTRLAERDFWVDTKDMRIMHEDGRMALNRLRGERFDVVIGDAFTDIAVPQHLITQEFLALVKRRLAPGGIYLMNLVDRADRRDALAAMVATMRTVFPAVQVWVETEDIAAGGRTTFVLAGAETLDNDEGLSETGPLKRMFLRMTVSELDRLIAAKNPPTLTDDYAPIDRLIAVID